MVMTRWMTRRPAAKRVAIRRRAVHLVSNAGSTGTLKINREKVQFGSFLVSNSDAVREGMRAWLEFQGCIACSCAFLVLSPFGMTCPPQPSLYVFDAI